jgi:hypothetical protein
MIRRAGLLACVALLLAASVVLAGGSIGIQRHVLSSGGGMVESGVYRLHATVGQPVAGPISDLAPGRALCAGFWCGAGQRRMTVIYLPLVLK